MHRILAAILHLVSPPAGQEGPSSHLKASGLVAAAEPALLFTCPHPQGNIEFVETEDDGLQKGGLAVVEEALVDHVAELTATPRDLVLRSLLARTVASGGRDLIEKGHTVAEASYARDACAKVPKGCWKGEARCPVRETGWAAGRACCAPRLCTSGCSSGW